MQGIFTRRRIGAPIVAAALLLGGCASLPSLEAQRPSTAITDTADTLLGRSIAPDVAANPGKSGIYALNWPRDAFAARVVLARAAERSLDVQYYIWHGDTTGYLLLEELWNAAERGVRVRLLLDDNGVAGLDPIIAAMDSNANIEIRLYNPYVNRSLRSLGYLTDFSRLNRRMHNKSFTADSQVTIVGGRNVGDDYFGAGDGISFADLDVIAAGPIASQVASAFDLYWNSASAYPATSIVAPPGPDAVPAMKKKFAEVNASKEAAEYVAAVKNTPLIEQLRAGRLALDWVPVSVVYDEPSKTLGKAQASDLLFTRLMQDLGQAQQEIDIISPYFVPGEKGVAALCKLPERHVRLRILTNSLAATDVGAVHAAYGKSRVPLLRCGASLYELKPDASHDLAGAQAEKEHKSIGGSSSASLHAKTFSLDRNRAFVGSFNLDPRSTKLNTEMGLVIESPKLASAITDGLDRKIEKDAYHVVLDASGHHLEWIEHTPQGEVRHTTEPDTGLFERMGVKILSWLPIDWMM
jgi:cardiolipin synthase C